MNSKFFYFKRLIGRSYKKSNMQIIIYDPNVVGIIPKNFNYYYHVYFCEFFNEIIWFNFLRVNIYLFVGLLELQEQSVSLRSLFAEITCFPICYFLAGYWCIKCLARIIHRFYEY